MVLSQNEGGGRVYGLILCFLDRLRDNLISLAKDDELEDEEDKESNHEKAKKNLSEDRHAHILLPVCFSHVHILCGGFTNSLVRIIVIR